MHHKTSSAKQWKSRSAQWVIAAGLGIMASGVSKPVLAQSEITPAGNGRFYVELKDASLYDAIQLVLKAAGNPAANYIVDESAKDAPIGAVTFNNAAWDSIIRRLSNEAGFVIRLNPDGTKVVEPRAPVVVDGGEFGGGESGGGYPGSNSGSGSSSSGYPGGRGGYPGGGSSSSSSGYPGGGLPQNPFGAGGGRRTRRTRPTAETQASPQTNPALAGGAAGDDAGKEYRLIIVRHVYVGGIAQLFANSDIISTEDFLIPESALGGGQNGGGGGGFGGGGGGGGFGGGGGGFGGGGGGFGGGGGGFGGGGGGLGGGGGGFGGGGGGFGGGGGGLGGGGGGFGGF